VVRILCKCNMVQYDKTKMNFGSSVSGRMAWIFIGCKFILGCYDHHISLDLCVQILY
jgi:hypothetical protein